MKKVAFLIVLCSLVTSKSFSMNLSRCNMSGIMEYAKMTAKKHNMQYRDIVFVDSNKTLYMKDDNGDLSKISMMHDLYAPLFIKIGKKGGDMQFSTTAREAEMENMPVQTWSCNKR